MKDTLRILMEGTPSEISYDSVKKDLLKIHFLLENDFFVLKWVVSGCRQEMAKSTFGLALSAQLIDLPLHREFGRQRCTFAL